MSADDRMTQLASFARLVEPTLEQRSYYDLLNVSPTADLPTLRKAYYDVATKLHPDRYTAMPDAEAKRKLETIFARIAEGYRVVSDPAKRALYDEAIAKGQKRLLTTSREKRGPVNIEDQVKHPEAKKFFRLGMIAMGNRDFKGAALNFNFARTFDPSSALIAEKLAEAKTAAQKPAG